jgi:UDP-glucose 6-dehydrogenase
MHRDLLRYTKFVAACDSGALESAHDMLIDGGLDALAVDWAPEQLELAKLLSTTYPALLIAWAQEMERYCREVGGEYPEITAFFAEQVHLPRFAFAPGHIGGHCLMPNLDLLDGVRRSDFVDAIRASNKMVEPTGERPTPASLESIVAGLRNPLS